MQVFLGRCPGSDVSPPTQGCPVLPPDFLGMYTRASVTTAQEGRWAEWGCPAVRARDSLGPVWPQCVGLGQHRPPPPLPEAAPVPQPVSDPDEGPARNWGWGGICGEHRGGMWGQGHRLGGSPSEQCELYEVPEPFQL